MNRKFADADVRKFASSIKICAHTDRVEICRDRRDRRSCKIFANCVNFPRKQHDFMHYMRKSTRFTHLMCDFALKLLKLYTLS